MTTLLIAALLLAQNPTPQTVQIPPFTQSFATASVDKLSLAESAPSVPGTFLDGIKPTHALKIQGLHINPVEGLIEVWVKPSWEGNDHKRHVLWQTEEAGGRQITLEKSELGMLRAVLKTPEGVTVARASVSNWKQGQWKLISFGWLSNKGRNVGMALWIDRIAVDGPVTPDAVFDMSQLPSSILLGDSSGDTTFDELAIRTDLRGEGNNGMVACIYRDYLRGAPCEAIKIDVNSTRVPSDLRAIAGYEKQFGLQEQDQGRWEPVTDNVVRYGQWAYFDAKPFIKWTTNNSEIATIDANGRLHAQKPGKCEVTATFKGRTASYPLTVISLDKPDLGVVCIELLPRYRNDAVKDRIAPGETATAHVRFGNFGRKEVPAGAKIRFELTPDTIRNYRIDPSEKPVKTFEASYDKAIAPGEEVSVEFKFPFPAQSTWMRLKLDPENKIDEICEANNTIDELTDARPVKLGYTNKTLRECMEKPRMNHVGSFSYYDWLRAEKLRMDVVLREAVYPQTSPDGVREAYRIDNMIAQTGEGGDNDPFSKVEAFYDGGFPVNEPVDMMAIDCAIIHEFGHCMLSQPDLYGYPTSMNNVFITDDDGKPVAGSPILPAVRGNDLAASPGVNVACYVGYESLMEGCQLVLHPSQAGHIEYFKGFRQDRFWGTQGRLIPTRGNWLMITDANDQPLKNAAVYVYHVTQAPVQDSGAKFFPDRPKFVGNTDSEGRYTFPGETDSEWDDPLTDEVDGTVSVWNPFGTAKKETAFTPNVWEVEGLLLIKIVSNGKTEFQFLDLTQFNNEFLSGHTVLGKYTVQTSLTSSKEPVAIVRKPIPEAIKKVNKAPVAVAPKEMTVKCGEEFTIDGSKSFDPEGQPLIYRWDVSGHWLAGNLSQGPTMTVKAPNEPGEKEYKFWVLDGIRSSEAAIIKVKFVK